MKLCNRRPAFAAPCAATTDKRAQPRTRVHLTLTLVHDDGELPGCHVRDISEKGLYIVLPRETGPALRAPVSLRFHIWTGHDHMTRVLHAEVLRHERGGLAGAIINQERIARAVVHDILYYQQRLHRKAGVLSKRLRLGHNINIWVAKLIS